MIVSFRVGANCGRGIYKGHYSLCIDPLLLAPNPQKKVAIMLRLHISIIGEIIGSSIHEKIEIYKQGFLKISAAKLKIPHLQKFS